jgi:hypothetical protein
MYGIIASLPSGLRSAAVLLGQPSPSPSRPSIPGTTALPASAQSSRPNRFLFLRWLQPRESAEVAVLIKDRHLETITAAIPKWGSILDHSSSRPFLLS